MAVKWLIAGAGDIVKSRAAAALAETRNAETVAIFAPSAGKAEAIASRFGIPKVFHDYGRALAESGADAVYIATPHHVHVRMALQALRAGRHFLCEKPLGINADECSALLVEVRRHPELVTSCSNYRLFTNQFQTTRRLIASGELGDLIGGWAHDEEPYYNPSKAPLVRDKGMSPVLGFGFYLLNMAQILFGTPESVFASSSSFNCANESPYDIDDYDNIILRYPGGRQFAIHLNFATQGPLRHSYEFALSRGRIAWPRCPPHFNVPIRVATGWAETDVAGSFTGEAAGSMPNWHKPMFQDVTDAIISGGRALCTVESAAETARVTAAVFRSMESHRPEAVESPRKILSTDVEIPDEGVPVWNGGMQYTTRMEKRPETIDDEAAYLKWKWRMNLANPATGLDNDALIAGVKRIVAEAANVSGRSALADDWYDVAADCFDFLVDNVAIGFSRFDCFPTISAWERHSRPMGAILWQRAAEVDDKYFPGLRDEIDKMRKEGRATIGKDFDHSAPDWADILKLGFPGMKARVDAYTPDTPFYRAEKRAAAAMMRFLDRLIDEGKRELAVATTSPSSRDGETPSPHLLAKAVASLERLRVGPPQSVFDIMEFTMVYFILSEPLNYFQVRTFDNIDVRWWPYYQADLAAGRTTEAEFREEFRHFLWQFGSIDNYWGHPIYLGGTNQDGTTAYNPLSLVILDVVEKTALPTPKFQLKMAKNTPDEIWWKALDMLRKHCPLCLMSEGNMARSMKPVGLTDEECRDLLIWGCFEYLPRAKGNCTSASRVLLPQPVTEIMSKAAKGEFAAATFDDFKREYFRILHANTDRTVEILRDNERHLAEVNPALVLSLAVGSALEKGVDAFSLGYKYNFTTISELGFATAVDSLLAVKEFVYDKKAVSLQELGTILDADWKGHEELRLRMKNSKLKWGCGNPEADALAKEVIEGYTSHFVGKPNGRGGVFVCYGLNARGYVEGGRMTGATPDGRHKGDHLSKNMAPSVGAETEGITGFIQSYAAIAPENFPCGSIYDVMIHPSAVAGEKGLRVFRMLVERFYAVGGVAMNINIVSPETLRDAQAHPEKYENLQVRVAGWNIRWNDIPRREQDDFIARIETVGA